MGLVYPATCENPKRSAPHAENQIARIGRNLARYSAGSDEKTCTIHLFQPDIVSIDASFLYLASAISS